MNVFIDTNVLLDFFRMSRADLEELRKIAHLSANGRITILVSDLVTDEFDRNREGVISKSVSQFEKSTFELHRPNIVREHPESIELEQLKKQFHELVKTLSARVVAEARNRTTKADVVIAELFDAATIHSLDDDTIERARKRTLLGRPPGKKGALGDAIHWEWLLDHVATGEELYLISRDGDFESAITEGALSGYLEDEWSSRKESRCTLYTSFAEFLNAKFTDVDLADEIDKRTSIERLLSSANFATTHNALAHLSKFDDYTPRELLQLIAAYDSNNQIKWIIGDDDVKAFAQKLITMAHGNQLIDEVYPIKLMLSELELRKL